MREGELFINGKDAYITFGIFLGSERKRKLDNQSALLTPPPAKKHTTVAYRERGGEEVDVSEVRFEARDLSLRFAMLASNEQDFLSKYQAFVDVLKSGMIDLRVSALGKTYKLYYLSCPNAGLVLKTRLRTTGRIAALWTVKFREPRPEF